MPVGILLGKERLFINFAGYTDLWGKAITGMLLTDIKMCLFNRLTKHSQFNLYEKNIFEISFSSNVHIAKVEALNTCAPAERW